MPNIIVIAGPNGAGKSTLAPYLLRDTLGIVEYVNADTIAEGLSAFAPENAALDAGRIMLGRMNELADSEKNFAFEATLAGQFYAKWISNLKKRGFSFQLVYLWLKSPELAVERVRERVRADGHDIPENTIRRRYERSLRNFLNIYEPVADAWRVYDASAKTPQIIAYGDKLSGAMIIKRQVWKKMISLKKPRHPLL